MTISLPRPDDWVLRMPELGGRDVVFPNNGLLYSFAALMRFFGLASSKERAYRVVDVGACVGGYALVLLAKVPNCQVVCFEPWAECWPYWHYNLKGLNAELHGAALSDKAGELELSLCDKYYRMGQASAYGDGVSARKVPTVTLDSAVTGVVHLLKVDVEGHELEVLRGGERLLAEQHPTVMVEMKDAHQKRAGRTAGTVDDYLRGLGYAEGWLHSAHDYVYEWKG